MSMHQEVPTLDLRRFDTDRTNFVRDVGEAYRTYGFCCFSHHGIPEALIQAAYENFKEFFALSTEEKMKYSLVGKGGARGYTPFKVETAKDQTIADLKEFWHVGRDVSDNNNPYPNLLLPNLWPEEVANFRQHSLMLYQAMESVSDRILTSMALHIGLPADYFIDVIKNGDSILRALHYPPVKFEDLPAVRAGAHEDIDLITLLVGATNSGLELLTKEGEWLPINATENTLVVNVGDMLQRLTNHVYRSTTHRVVNPATADFGKPRFSMPFFVHPRPDFLIKTLPQCVSPQNPDRYAGTPITAQEYLNERLREIKLS